MPQNARPSFAAATAVVPLPANGSKIKSFSLVEAKMIFARSFSGFCVGWSVFSGIDQKGTVKSVQRFDGCVSRKFPSPDFSQSFGAPFSVYGASTRRLILTASVLNVKSSETVKNQMSSEEFFQFARAPRPFSRSQVMRLRSVKNFIPTR